MTDLIIYHGNCPDGFTAAWAATKAYPEAELFPGFYGQEPPDVAGRDVVVVDFSYPRETLLRMHAEASRLRVFDHHKTAKEDLEGLNFCVFDMERSGAGLAWDCLVGKPRPWLVEYVEDRDLWRRKLLGSKEVSAYVMSTPYELEAWDELAAMPLDQVMNGGIAIRRNIEAYVATVGSNARLVRFEGHDVPLVNAPQTNISDLLHDLCRDGGMAVGWWQCVDGRFQYSLRSVGDLDVSAIAKKWGGGGHVNAAGFVVDEMLHFPAASGVS